MLSSLLLAAELVLPITEVVERPDFRVSHYPAKVIPIAKVEVVPQVSGEIIEVAFQNGRHVKKGDVLYRLDPVKYEAAVKNAEAKVAECEANVKYADLSHDRHRNLVEARAVSLDAADNALSQRDKARAALVAAQAELVSAKDALNHTTIISPISGKLGSTLKTEGNYVTAGSSPLVTIVQLDPIRIGFAVSNREILDLMTASDGARRVKSDVSVKVTLANGKPLESEGELEYLDNESDESTDTLMVYARFANPVRQLIPGGTVSASVSSKAGVNRPAVPPTAILQDTQGPYVWVVGQDGLVERRSIARGDQVGDWLFVEKGLAVGEKIVADGAHKVKRGMTIRAAE